MKRAVCDDKLPKNDRSGPLFGLIIQQVMSDGDIITHGFVFYSPVFSLQTDMNGKVTKKDKHVPSPVRIYEK
jgi:hypothetical protein